MFMAKLFTTSLDKTCGYENGTVQLFDLENDIGQQHDLAKTRPDIAEKLKKMLLTCPH